MIRATKKSRLKGRPTERFFQVNLSSSSLRSESCSPRPSPSPLPDADTLPSHNRYPAVSEQGRPCIRPSLAASLPLPVAQLPSAGSAFLSAALHRLRRRPAHRDFTAGVDPRRVLSTRQGKLCKLPSLAAAPRPASAAVQQPPPSPSFFPALVVTPAALPVLRVLSSPLLPRYFLNPITSASAASVLPPPLQPPGAPILCCSSRPLATCPTRRGACTPSSSSRSRRRPPPAAVCGSCL